MFEVPVTARLEGRRKDLVLRLERGMLGRHLLEALGASLGEDASFLDAVVARTNERVEAEDSLDRYALLAGDTLDLERRAVPHAAMAGGPMAWEIRVVEGPYRGSSMVLGEGDTLVGREVPTGGLTLAEDHSVSRVHAAVTVGSGRPVVVDRGSTNGTFVNGRRIGAPTALSAGDTVTVGQSVLELATTREIQGKAPPEGGRGSVRLRASLGAPAGSASRRPTEAIPTSATVAGAPPIVAPRRPTGSEWALLIAAGPRAGARHVLPYGETRIGRDDEFNGLSLGPDQAASLDHARLSVSPDQLVLTDSGSTNGTVVNGVRIDGPVALAPADVIAIGDSVLIVAPTFALRALPGYRHLTYGDGRLGFNRQPRVVHPDPSATVPIAAPPATPHKRRLPMAAAVVPVVMGVAIFAFTRSAFYLLFAAIGPVMAVWTFVDDKRSGRREFKEAASAYRASLTEAAGQVAAAHARATTWRRTNWPSPTTIAQLGASLAPDLWERRPQDADFLDLRVGVADQPSLVTVEIGDGGDEELRAAAIAIRDHVAVDPAVPVVAPLRDLGILGIAGPVAVSRGLVRSVVLQLATLHSPRDLALVVLAPDDAESWAWAKWLPHVQVLSDDGTVTIAGQDAEAQSLFAAVRRVADTRAEAAAGSIGSPTRFSPHLVVFVQPPVQIPPRDMSDLLRIASSLGIAVVWIAPERSELPNECRGIVEVDPARLAVSLTFADTGHRIGDAQRVDVPLAAAMTEARFLAPLVDVTVGSDSGGIPRRVNLLELLDLVPVTADAVAARWQADGGNLTATVGALATGPATIDLRVDGPHGLVAGTTGAGKSEFLQALVASLAIAHPPDRLNFVFVDYKGGAAFKDCIHLPHAVGIVTDLDGHLTQRALLSLDAELKRREHMLAGVGAKDLLEMIDKAPDRAPAALMIIIDEFAALAKEVPAFVDGVVDIAQRGRSLGVHLLLATQKPGGVISASIQANTNLRVALRMADAEESRDVIERPDAALISKRTPGRGYLKTGPRDITEFQSAYVGGTSELPDDTEPVATATTFHVSGADRRRLAAAVEAKASGQTDLQRAVAACTAAATAAGVPTPHRPWLPPLGAAIGLEETIGVFPPADDTLQLPLGVADEPARQAQYAWALDLDQLGSVVIYGSAGSGKTTALRSVAASTALRFRPDQVRLYALDFGSRGLASLSQLPHCGGVVTPDEIDRVRRLLAMLEVEAIERRAALGSVGASSSAEYRRATGRPMPEIVVLVDGFAGFWAAVEPIDRSAHAELFQRLVADGKAVGQHFVVTADRRTAIPHAMASTVPGRLVLRMANPDEYGSLGLPHLAREQVDPDPGRAFTADGLELQIAGLRTPEGGDGIHQVQRLTQLAAHLQQYYPDPGVPPVRLLPEQVSLAELPVPTAGTWQIPIGLDEASLEPAVIDLGEAPTFLIAGPDLSGRTTALAAITRGVMAAHPGGPAYLVSGRSTPLAAIAGWTKTGIGESAADVLAELVGTLDDRVRGGFTEPVLVVVDDADDLTEGRPADHLDALQKRARDAGVVVVAALSTFKAMRSYTNWTQSLRNSRHGLLLQPDLDNDESDVFHLRIPERAGLHLPAGRGYLVRRGPATLIQVAS